MEEDVPHLCQNYVDETNCTEVLSLVLSNHWYSYFFQVPITGHGYRMVHSNVFYKDFLQHCTTEFPQRSIRTNSSVSARKMNILQVYSFFKVKSQWKYKSINESIAALMEEDVPHLCHLYETNAGS